MNTLTTLFRSPEFYPQWMDFENNVLHFVRMSRESYQSSVFLDMRTQHLGEPLQKINLDEVLHASAGNDTQSPRVHYILNTAFCCSTLLARYFELFPDCFVLKEPSLLSQLALEEPGSHSRWEDVFEVCLKLLSRTYLESERAVIKVHEACNVFGDRLLQDPEITITFLSTPVRRFVLSTLKVEDRREWVRRRLNEMTERHEFAELFEGLDIAALNDAQAACSMWMANRLISQRLSASDRVLVLNGDDVATHPVETLTQIAKTGGFVISEQQLETIVRHPSFSRYSKNSSIAYNAASRKQEMEQLERQWGDEAEAGIQWMQARKGHLVDCGV